MPYVRIDLLKGRSETQVTAIGNAVHQAMAECLGVPARDHFQVINEHAPGRLVYNAHYLDIERTDGIVLVQVFLSAGRTTEQKQAFYARTAELMAQGGVRPQDVAISLVPSTREDWSFGNGVAQYVVLPKEAWK
jgi:4-oxalocrotonate tautomerase